MGQQASGLVRDVMFIGLDNAGKTTLIKQIAGEVGLHQTIPTFGYSGYLYMHSIPSGCKNKSYKFNLVDLSGHQSMRQQWNHYYDTSLGYVFVFDAADIHRFPEVQEAMLEVIAQSENKAILFCGNKQDQLNSIKSQSEFEKQFDINLTKRMKFVATVGTEYDNEGVIEGVKWILNEVLKTKYAAAQQKKKNLKSQGKYAGMSTKQKWDELERLRKSNDKFDELMKKRKEEQADDDIPRISQSQELQQSQEVKSMYSSISAATKHTEKPEHKQIKAQKKLPPIEVTLENADENNGSVEFDTAFHAAQNPSEQQQKKKRAKGILENIEKIHVAQ